MEKTVVTVTGGTGYIASWIVKDLLETGHDVRMTVRDKSQVEKYQHLLDIEKEASGSLKVFQCDLLEKDSFDEAVKGAKIVMHTASPFFLDDKNDPMKHLVEPAVKGTQNVLSSVNKSGSVTRVILTSSIAAIYGDNVDMINLGINAFNEGNWNETSSLNHNAYSYSKTEAEKAAWTMMRTQKDWDLVTIHPGFVLGPSLSKRVDSTSINTLLRILRGELKIGAPDLGFVFSDVRDISKAHLLAAFNKKALGRYIVAGESGNLISVAEIIEKAYPGTYALPKKKVPKFLIWLIGPSLGFTRRFVKSNIGYKIAVDNSRSIQELGMTYHTLEETIIDHVEQLKADGLIVTST